MIEKITLKVGKKTIELTAEEYEELRQHFDSLRAPYYIPYPVYPTAPAYPNYPIITCDDTSAGYTA